MLDMTHSWESSISAENDEEVSRRRRHFEELLAEHRTQVYHYIYSLVPRDSDAEDLCQRCSVVMWKKFAEYDRDRSFIAWAYGIAYFEVQNFRRATGADRMMFRSDLVQSLAARLEQITRGSAVDRVGALRTCLKRLPERDRLLVNQIYWDGCTYEDAAQKCGVTTRTAYNRMHLIRKQLLGCVARKIRSRRAQPEE